MDHLPAGTVTLLFTDVEGSTQLVQRLGADYGAVLAEYRDLLRRVFKDTHGQEVDTQGDSFFVAFHRAADALEAAVAVQRAVAQQAWAGNVTFRTRISIHTGEPSVAAGGYVGLD